MILVFPMMGQAFENHHNLAPQNQSGDVWHEPQFPYRDAPYDWAAEFGDDSDLILDIGFGRDTRGLEWISQNNPDANVIGIEQFPFPEQHLNYGSRIRIVHKDERVHQSRLAMFPDASVRQVFIISPTPPEGRSDLKSTLFDAGHQFVIELKRVLKPGGRVLIFTEDSDYARTIWKQLEAMGLETSRPIQNDFEWGTEGWVIRMTGYPPELSFNLRARANESLGVTFFKIRASVSRYPLRAFTESS